MDTYTVGQTIYRAYMGNNHRVYTVEFKIKSVHGNYVRITAEWNCRKLTPGIIHEYAEKVEHIISSYASITIEALEKLGKRKQHEQEEQADRIADLEADLRSINSAMLDDPPLELWGIYDDGGGELVLAAQSESQAWEFICAIKGRDQRDLEKRHYRCNRVLAREHWEFPAA